MTTSDEAIRLGSKTSQVHNVKNIDLLSIINTLIMCYLNPNQGGVIANNSHIFSA